MIQWNDRRVKLSSPKSDTYGEKLPGGLKPRTMRGWTDRANVLAAAKGGSIKAAPKHDMVEVENISKFGTRLLGEASLGFKPKKMVAKGSRAEAKAQKKIAWAENYEKAQDAKYEQQARIDKNKRALKAKKAGS